MSGQDPSSTRKAALNTGLSGSRSDRLATDSDADTPRGDGDKRRRAHTRERDDDEVPDEGDDPPQLPAGTGATGPPTGGNRDIGGGGGGEGDDAADSGDEPIDWPRVMEAANRSIIRGRRYWGPTTKYDPAPNSLSIADCIQQAVTDVLIDGMPKTQAEAEQRVAIRAQRVWKTYLETSLRQWRIRGAVFAPDLEPTLSEVLDATVVKGDIATVFYRCFKALAGQRDATKILYIVLQDGCGWGDHARMQAELNLTTAEINKAKAQIVDAITRILS